MASLSANASNIDESLRSLPSSPKPAPPSPKPYLTPALKPAAAWWEVEQDPDSESVDRPPNIPKPAKIGSTSLRPVHLAELTRQWKNRLVKHLAGMYMESTESLIRQVDLFAGLDDQSLSQLLDRSRTIKFRKNTILMTEGETGESLYIVKSGSLKIYVSDEEGGEMTLFIEGPGSYVGEISLLDDAPRTASVMALENTEVLVISKSLFYECIAHNPEIAFGLIRIVTQRLRKATDDLRTLALKNVYQRLALKLIELSEEQNGVRVLNRKYSQEAFSKMIGSSREMVGKVLNELDKGGFTETKDGKIRLLKPLPHDF